MFILHIIKQDLLTLPTQLMSTGLHWGQTQCALGLFFNNVLLTSLHPPPQWLCSPSMQQQRRTLWGDAVCFLFITPLAGLSGWLCVQGATELYYTNSMEALGLLVLTLALFSIYVFWTLVRSGSLLVSQCIIFLCKPL